MKPADRALVWFVMITGGLIGLLALAAVVEGLLPYFLKWIAA
jgi:hypothetical protein